MDAWQKGAPRGTDGGARSGGRQYFQPSSTKVVRIGRAWTT